MKKTIQNVFIQYIKKSVQRVNKTHKKFTWNQLAQYLKISKSYLSQILSDKKSFPIEYLDSLIEFLDLDDLARFELIQCYLQNENQRLIKNSKHLKKYLQTAQSTPYGNYIGSITNLNIQSLDLFDRWYYTAILDLVDTTDFKMDLEWIAERLHISKTLAEISWNLLVSKGCLVLSEEGKWQKSQKKFRMVVGDNTKNNEKDIVRTRYNYYSQFMELTKAQILAGSSTKHNRLIQGVTCSANPSNLDEVKINLEKNLYDTASQLSEGDCTEVYFLMTVAIPLTTRKS